MNEKKIQVPANVKVHSVEARLRRLPTRLIELTISVVFTVGIGVKESVIGYKELAAMKNDFVNDRKFVTEKGAIKKAKKVAKRFNIAEFDVVWYKIGPDEKEIETDRKGVQL